MIDVTLGELEVAENDGLISNRPTAGETVICRSGL